MVEEGVEADSSAAMSHCYWYCAATQAANRKRLAVRAAAEKSKRKQGEKFCWCGREETASAQLSY